MTDEILFVSNIRRLAAFDVLRTVSRAPNSIETMLDFIWHLRGSVILGVPDGEATDRLACFLRQQRKTITERGPDYLVFDKPIWGGLADPNWLALGMYDKGLFWIEHSGDGRRFRYKLRSLHGLIFCSFVAVMVFIICAAYGGAVRGLILGAFAWSWLYGMNVLIALARAPSSIRRALRGT